MTTGFHRSARTCLPSGALLLVATITLFAVACGDDDHSDTDSGPPVEDILQEALGRIGRFEPVNLDTRALARAVQAGQMESGTTLMHSAFGFTPSSIYVYDRGDATDVIGPLLRRRLTDSSDATMPCSAAPIGSGS